MPHTQTIQLPGNSRIALPKATVAMAFSQMLPTNAAERLGFRLINAAAIASSRFKRLFIHLRESISPGCNAIGLRAAV